MTTLEIKDLHVSVVSAEDGTDIPILKGVNLTVKSGETHALMGPNGSGKSTLSYAVAGHPKYTVTSGSITLDGQDVLRDDHRRARTCRTVPGHAVPHRGARRVDVELPAHRRHRRTRRGAEAAALDQGGQVARWRASTSTRRSPNAVSTKGFPAARRSATRSCSSPLLKPKIAILDETDSGLDVDALRVVSDGVNRYAEEVHGGVLLITHYTRILRYIQPQFVHVFVGGRIVESGGPELADELDANGYERFTQAVGSLT